MANYISIISRSDFNDLYKFGHLFVHNLVPFEGELGEHIEDKPLFDAVTKYMNTYEYSTEYLLLHIRRAVFSGSVIELFIKDIMAVYALDSESKASLSVSLDPRINIQVSFWESYFMSLNKKQLIRQADSGKFNCYEIFNISDEDRNKIESFLPKDFLNELFTDLFENKRPSGKKSIWTYLLRYDRHGAFYKDNRGFFSDAVNVFENYLNQKEMSYEWDEDLEFAEIIENSGTRFGDICRNLTSGVTSKYTIDGCNYYAVAPLYLYMKSYFGDRGIMPSSYYQNEYLSKGILYKQYGFDFALAVALLGIKFGHDLTYGCYYEIKNLGIFNRTISSESLKTKILNPITGKNLSVVEAQELIDSLSFNVEELKEEISKLKECKHKEANEASTEKQADAVIEETEKEESAEAPSEEQPESAKEEAAETPSEEQPESAKEEAGETPSEEQLESAKEETAEAPSEEQLESAKEETAEAPSEEQPESAKDEAAEAPSEEQLESAKEETVETPSEEQPESAKDEAAEAPSEEQLESAKEETATSNETLIEVEEKSGAIYQSKINQEDNNLSYFEPIEMRKLNKNGTAFINKPKTPKWVRSQKEYEEKLKEGWATLDYFDKGTFFNSNN